MVCSNSLETLADASEGAAQPSAKVAGASDESHAPNQPAENVDGAGEETPEAAKAKICVSGPFGIKICGSTR